MNASNISSEKKEESSQNKLQNILENTKSNYILKKIFANTKNIKVFSMIKYNKSLQKRLNITFDDYKEYSKIEIEIIPIKYRIGEFIHIKEKDKPYFHIYFNNNKNETKLYKLSKNTNVEKIKVIIDYQVNSFNGLFFYCDNIESINFKKFNRGNIIDMHSMFNRCKSLKKLNLSNFNTDNVNDMSNMFYKCNSLKDLNLSNFNTNNVTDMSNMFYKCKSLQKLNISNFNIDKINYINGMFYGCKSLIDLNFPNFKIRDNYYFQGMFYKCPTMLKIEFKSKYPNLKVEAFKH